MRYASYSRLKVSLAPLFLKQILTKRYILVVVTEAYSGSLKRYLSFLPLIGYAGIVPQIVTLGRSFAVKLTSWENHRACVLLHGHQLPRSDPVAHTATHQAHSQSHVFKMFAIHAIVSYGVLALTAYAYRKIYHNTARLAVDRPTRC